MASKYFSGIVDLVNPDLGTDAAQAFVAAKPQFGGPTLLDEEEPIVKSSFTAPTALDEEDESTPSAFSVSFSPDQQALIHGYDPTAIPEVEEEFDLQVDKPAGFFKKFKDALFSTEVTGEEFQATHKESMRLLDSIAMSDPVMGGYWSALNKPAELVFKAPTVSSEVPSLSDELGDAGTPATYAGRSEAIVPQFGPFKQMLLDKQRPFLNNAVAKTGSPVADYLLAATKGPAGMVAYGMDKLDITPADFAPGTDLALALEAREQRKKRIAAGQEEESWLLDRLDNVAVIGAGVNTALVGLLTPAKMALAVPARLAAKVPAALQEAKGFVASLEKAFPGQGLTKAEEIVGLNAKPQTLEEAMSVAPKDAPSIVTTPRVRPTSQMEAAEFRMRDAVAPYKEELVAKAEALAPANLKNTLQTTALPKYEIAPEGLKPLPDNKPIREIMVGAGTLKPGSQVGIAGDSLDVWNERFYQSLASGMDEAQAARVATADTASVFNTNLVPEDALQVARKKNLLGVMYGVVRDASAPLKRAAATVYGIKAPLATLDRTDLPVVNSFVNYTRRVISEASNAAKRGVPTYDTQGYSQVTRDAARAPEEIFNYHDTVNNVDKVNMVAMMQARRALKDIELGKILTGGKNKDKTVKMLQGIVDDFDDMYSPEVREQITQDWNRSFKDMLRYLVQDAKTLSQDSADNMVASYGDSFWPATYKNKAVKGKGYLDMVKGGSAIKNADTVALNTDDGFTSLQNYMEGVFGGGVRNRALRSAVDLANQSDSVWNEAFGITRKQFEALRDGSLTSEQLFPKQVAEFRKADHAMYGDKIATAAESNNTRILKSEDKATQGFIKVSYNGNEVILPVKDKEWMNMFTSMNPLSTEGAPAILQGVDKLGTGAASLMRFNIVTSPEFLAGQFMKDGVQAARTAKGLSVPVVNNIFGAKKLLTDGQFMDEFINNLGGGENISALGYKNTGMNFGAMAQEGKLADYTQPTWEKAKSLVNKLSTSVKKPLITAEATPRVEAYTRAINAGMSPTDAITLAADSTADFGTVGSSQVLRWLNRYIPFTRATVAGIDRELRLAKNPLEYVTKGQLYIGTPHVVDWMFNHDNPDYVNLSQAKKSAGIWVPIEEDTGRLTGVLLPTNYSGLSSMFTALPSFLDNLAAQEGVVPALLAGKAFVNNAIETAIGSGNEEYAKELAGLMPSLNEKIEKATDEWVKNDLPALQQQAVKGFLLPHQISLLNDYELLVNKKDPRTGRLLEKEGDDTTANYTPDTPAIARLLGDSAGISPEVMDVFLANNMKVMYRGIVGATEDPLRGRMGLPKATPKSDMEWLLPTFAVKESSTKQEEAYHLLYKKLVDEDKISGYKQYVDNFEDIESPEDKQRAIKWRTDNENILPLLDVLADTKNEIWKVNNNRKIASGSFKYTNEDMLKAYKQMVKQKQTVYERFYNDVYTDPVYRRMLDEAVDKSNF